MGAMGNLAALLVPFVTAPVFWFFLIFCFVSQIWYHYRVSRANLGLHLTMA